MTRPRCPGQDTRYWTPDDIFEIPCPYCGDEMEFFKDDPALTCPSCQREVRNPRIELGCARWCQFAGECLGQLPGDPERSAPLCDRLIEEMKSVFGDDRKRIDHALAVLGHANTIMESERVKSEGEISALVVRAAAILHDIGIHEAERKYGRSSGPLQELEGPPIAREILENLGVDPESVDHVCQIVANHHSARDIDTPEFRIVWDADWLVNIAEELDTSDRTKIEKLVVRVFKTDGGRRLAGQIL
jgi:HD superfamily phosphodiesterase